MVLSVNQNDKTPSNIGISLQGQFLDHFLRAMERLQDSMKGEDDDTRWEAFLLQAEYLKHLIPDRTVQDGITAAIDGKIKEYKDNGTYKGRHFAEYVANLEIITEIVVYLNEGLDLVHDDILGPLTPRAAEAAKENDLPGKKNDPKS